MVKISAREAARRLGLGPDTIRRYAAAGKIRARKEIVHEIDACDGTTRHFLEGVEMWVVSEEEIERIRKEGT